MPLFSVVQERGVQKVAADLSQTHTNQMWSKSLTSSYSALGRGSQESPPSFEFLPQKSGGAAEFQFSLCINAASSSAESDIRIFSHFSGPVSVFVVVSGLWAERKPEREIDKTQRPACVNHGASKGWRQTERDRHEPQRKGEMRERHFCGPFDQFGGGYMANSEIWMSPESSDLDGNLIECIFMFQDPERERSRRRRRRFQATTAPRRRDQGQPSRQSSSQG